MTVPHKALVSLAAALLFGCGSDPYLPEGKETDCYLIRVAKPHADIESRTVHWDGLSALMKSGENCGRLLDVAYEVFVDRNGDTVADKNEVVFGATLALGADATVVDVDPIDAPFSLMEGPLLFRVNISMTNEHKSILLRQLGQRQGQALEI